MNVQSPPSMPRRVMIATPSLTGNLDVSYVWSLCETIKMSVGRNIIIAPMFLPQNSIIQAARDELLAIAHQAQADDMIWIDADISWKPEWIFKLLDYPVDVVGGTYRLKQDESEDYALKAQPWMLKADSHGLMQVEALGFGFVRFSKRAIDWLWDNSDPYWDNEQERRWAFDVRPRMNPRNNYRVNLLGEDIGLCNRLREEGGFTINLDPAMTCDHIGAKKFRGDFRVQAEKFYCEEQLELKETAA